MLVPLVPVIVAGLLDWRGVAVPGAAVSWIGLGWYASAIVFGAAAVIAYRRYVGALDFAGWLVAGCLIAIMGLSAAGAMGVASAPRVALLLWAVVVLCRLWSIWGHHRGGSSRADRQWQSLSALLAMLLVSVMLLVSAYAAGVVFGDEQLHRACCIAAGIAIGFALLFALLWVRTPAAGRAAARAGVTDAQTAAQADARRLATYRRVARWAEGIGLGLRMTALWLVLGVMIISAAHGGERLLAACCYAVVAGLVLSFAALAVSGIYGSMGNGPRRRGN